MILLPDPILSGGVEPVSVPSVGQTELLVLKYQYLKPFNYLQIKLLALDISNWNCGQTID